MIKQNKVIKVVLVSDCLANGGAEKVHALLSGYFHKAGLEVHNCIFIDWVTYDHSGSLLNLGKVSSSSNAIVRRIKKLWAFRAFIKQNHFDVVIDFRMRELFWREYFFSKFVYPENVLYSVRSGILEFYFPKAPFLARLIYKNRLIITVSKAIQQRILDRKYADKAIYMYNPIDFKSIALLKQEHTVAEEKYILAVGRMNDDVKQFDKLITAYAKSVLPGQNIKLVLLGEGQNRSRYQELASNLGVSTKVVFKGSVMNPFPYYKGALYMVLSSKNEGFPNVIIESLAVGTPVISFDCFSGPNEILLHGQNGLLVEDQNFSRLTEAMNLFIEDEMLLATCKKNSISSVAHFDLEIIGIQWINLLEKVIS